MSDQVRKVAAAPDQRWILLKLSVEKGKKLKGQRGRVFRRFLSAFKLDVIDETMRTKGGIAAARAANREPATFEVTAENIEFAREIDNDSERERGDEIVIGPFFDSLADDAAPPAADVPAYDRERDDWTPVQEADPVLSAVGLIVAHLRANGEEAAAAMVERGGWDKPEAPPSA